MAEPFVFTALAFPQISPVIIQLGPVAIHWYGTAYVVGTLFGWWYAKRLIRTPWLWGGRDVPLRPDHIDEVLVWASVGIVVGGRLGYILFYDLPHYLADPGDLLAIWHGGMSFHGGFLGTVLAVTLYARRKRISARSLFDVIAPGTPVALGLVRLANFINAELVGRPTTLPWGVLFPNAGPDARHPSQLYEAFLEGVVLFIVLRLLTHSLGKLARPGYVSGALMVGYGLIRIFVEFFREPDVQVGYLLGHWLTMGMVLSVPLVVAGAWAMAVSRRVRPTS